MDLDPEVVMETLRSVLAQSEGMMLALSPDGIIKAASPSTHALQAGQDPVGTRLSDLVHEADRSKLLPSFEGGAGEVEVEVRIQTEPRLWRNVELSISSAPAGIRLIRMRDTVRENSTRESLREYAHIKSALDASFPVSISDEEGQILHVNELFCRISGFDRHELLGSDLRLLLSGENSPETYQALWDTVGSGRTWRGELRNRRKDGSLYWVEIVVHPVRGKDDSFQRFIAISIPIDERKHAESEMLKARDEAREAAKAKGQFLSVMSHEIRTPLNAILGSAHLLERATPRPDQERTVQILRTSAQNLLHLVNDVLDFSKIEAGRLALETIPFELRPLLESIHAGLELAALRKGLDFSLEIDPQLPEWLEGDPTRIGQVITNLLSNAVKFTEKGFVRTSVKLLQKGREGLCLRFSVKDSGIGIATSQYELVFDAFAQAQSSTTRRFGGTGLGLSITRSLLELMDSRPEVESREGKGSHFWFDLWLAEGAPEESVSRGEENGELTGMRILLVEDNEFNVLVAGQFLSDWGVYWESVGNGKLALEAVRRSSWDLVLMDLQMPEMDGYEATRLIREFDKATPILALTASAQLDRRDKAFTLGMNDYVTKPIDPDLLLSKLRGYVPDSLLDVLPLFRQ